MTLAVGVHDPRHDLGVRVHVGGRDVPVDPQHEADLVRVPLRHLPQLLVAHAAGIDLDPALGSAEGQVDERGLPGHERGERADLVEVGLRMEPDPALARPAGAVVLHPVADEDLEAAVVHPDRDLDPHLPERGLEEDAVLHVEPGRLGAQVEGAVDGEERVLLDLVRDLALGEGRAGVRLRCGLRVRHSRPV
jgi:hypothetical protein